jgi:hypothetical protein
MNKDKGAYTFSIVVIISIFKTAEFFYNFN